MKRKSMGEQTGKSEQREERDRKRDRKKEMDLKEKQNETGERDDHRPR